MIGKSMYLTPYKVFTHDKRGYISGFQIDKENITGI
jgi:hypothetical protein